MFTLIDSLNDLEFLNQELKKKSYIAVDTEFRRTTKYNMKLGLLQINDEDEIYIIDAVLIDEPTKQVDFLFSNSVVKIFHSCREDLEAIYSWTEQKMVNVFDTQLANSFLGEDFSISYQALVEKKLGILLEKAETRSNWIRRPLTDSQLKYAALDVEYLIPIYKEQFSELSKYEKYQWFDEEIKNIIEFTLNPPTELNEFHRTVSRVQESEILSRLNTLIENTAHREKINSTMFFSKKAQKIFLRQMLVNGIEQSCEELTNWRRDLLEKDLYKLMG